jgi:nicotinamidase-related amidase
VSLVDDGAWLVVVDMQNVFAHPPSPWASPDYATALAGTRRLLGAFDDRVVFTRYVAPEEPEGAWRDYFDAWPFALVPRDDPLYDVVDDLDTSHHAVVTRTTFGKWGPELEVATHGAGKLVLAGVSTDCCVLSTALAAADAGRRVHIAADACAGASRVDHERALDVMRLYAPLVEVTSTDELLAGR